MEQRQTCPQCGSEKGLGEFFKNSVKANGHDSKCKECRKGNAKEYRKAHVGEIAEQRRGKYFERKEEIISQKIDYYRENREHILANKSEYWQKNKDKIKKKVSVWREENKDIIRARDKETRDSLIDAVLVFLGPVCVLCGETEREFLTVDHVDNDGNSERHMGSLGWKRRILDGISDSSRYRVLCHSCNLGRYRIDPVHHLSGRPKVGKSRLCIACHEGKDLSEFSSQSSHWFGTCLVCRRGKAVSRRQTMIRQLGGKCVCCGMSEWNKLVVDHVKNDGSMKRKSGERVGIDILSAIIRGKLPRADYQLLCWNCNHSKHRGKGLCVHQRNGTSFITGASPTFRNRLMAASMELADFSLDDLRVGRPGPDDDCRAFLNDHHYAGFGRPSSLLYVARVGGAVVAVAKFAAPVRQGIAATVGVESGQLLELDRFCVHPAYHKRNLASFFMSRTLKLLREDRPGVLKLVSFADPRFGHSGTIYQASNWEYVGKTARSYYYEDRDGLEVNKKTLYEFARSRKMTERQCVEALGYKKVHTPPKNKFVYVL